MVNCRTETICHLCLGYAWVESGRFSFCLDFYFVLATLVYVFSTMRRGLGWKGITRPCFE